MGKGIVRILILIMVVGWMIGGISKATISVEEYADDGFRVAYLQNGKIFVSDLDGKNKEVRIDLKDEKIRYFYVSPNRVNIALVTEKDNVFLFDGHQTKKILTGKGEISNIVFMNDCDLIISANCGEVVIDEFGQRNPLIMHFAYLNGDVKELPIQPDKKIMLAGDGNYAEFNNLEMLNGSFSIFNIRTGKGKKIITPDPNNSYFPEISPDGKYLAYYFKDESKDAKGGMGIRVYRILEKGLKKVEEHSPVYSYPSSFGPEPAVWSAGKLIIHVCFYAGETVRNSIMRIDPADVSYLHEGKYPTKGQYDLLVKDSLGEDVLFIYRENEKREYTLYLVPIKGCSEDKIEIAANVTVARFITRR